MTPKAKEPVDALLGIDKEIQDLMQPIILTLPRPRIETIFIHRTKLDGTTEVTEHRLQTQPAPLVSED